MKIPETSANVGAYYGNEENGQWQPNGVIIDSGVGGGVVGSGDAGIHRPPVYPVHIPRGHMPGYVMAGAYYPPAGYPPVPAPPPNDFADYMWMENEEEFDKQVMQQLEEEALMAQCIEAMLEDEQRERQHCNVANGHKHHYPTTSNGNPSPSLEETVSKSTLNPLAAEFVPTGARKPPLQSEDKQEKIDAPSTHELQKSREDPSPTEHPVAGDTNPEVIEQEQPKTEEPVPPPKDPPEVSAADVQPITDKQEKKKDTRKEIRPRVDTKKPVKTEIKPKAKPQIVKSETKVMPKKKEVKNVKSETKVNEIVNDVIVPIVELPKLQIPQVVEETTQAPSGPKPINYAAAAKANKPKKPTTPPATDKTTPPPLKNAPKTIEKLQKKDKPKTEKPAFKTEKASVQRKNSTK